MALTKSFTKPPGYVTATFVVSIGGLLFGLDTGSIGPITVMPQLAAILGDMSSTLHGLVVSMILIPAALASFLAGHLADKIGRPRAIAVGALIFAIGTTVEAAAVSLAMLLLGRIITGIGQGLFLSTLVVYICEIAPPRHRGALASFPQLLITLGLCAGYFVCYGSVKSQSSLAWRLPFALQSFIAYVFSLSAATLLPESPRWLTAHHRDAEASLVWDKLQVSDTEREKSQQQVAMASSEDAGHLPDSIPELAKRRVQALFGIFSKDARKQTLLGAFLMGMQQLSGIDGVLYYAPLLFQQAGLSSTEASFLASGVSAICIFAVSIPAAIFSDAWSRRASTIIGAAVMAICMSTIGSLYAAGSVHASEGAARWAVIVLIYIFSITYAVTWAVGIKIYASEIQPPKTRAAATSLAYSSNWVVNWVVAFSTPIFLSRSDFGPYFLFGGATALTMLVCIFFMPETRGKELESINALFTATQGPLIETSGRMGFGQLVHLVRNHLKKTFGPRRSQNVNLTRL